MYRQLDDDAPSLRADPQFLAPVKLAQPTTQAPQHLAQVPPKYSVVPHVVSSTSPVLDS
jgi:hypothetical protein